MANTYKNIVITTNIGSATDDPKIVFSGANTTTNTDITLRVYPTSNGTVSFEGSAGQLFSVTNQLTGTLFSVNDVSGIPSIEVLDTGLVKLAQYNGNVGIGTANASYKLDVNGTARISGNLIFSSTTSNGITFADGTRQTVAYNPNIDTTQNTNISIVQGGLNTANANISLTIGVDASQNTRIDAAFSKANTGALTSGYLANSIIFTDASGNIANTDNIKFFTTNNMLLVSNTNILGNLIVAGADFTTVNNTQNTNISIVQGGLNTANANISLIFGIDSSQNTRIDAAFSKANTGALTSGYLSNSVIFADLSGNLANTNNIKFFTANNTLLVTNVSITNNLYASNVSSQANDSIRFYTANGKQLQIDDANTTGAYTLFTRNSGTNIQAIGAMGTANFGLFTTGGGNFRFFTTSNYSEEQFRIAYTSSSVNHLQVSGNTTGNSPVLSAQSGTDTNVDININPKGTGVVNVNSRLTVSNTAYNALTVAGGVQVGAGTISQPSVGIGAYNRGFYNPTQGDVGFVSSGWEQVRFVYGGPTTSYLTFTGANTGNTTIIGTAGTDANVAINLVPKGNAAVMITGNTVGYIPQANSIYVGNRVGFANSNNISVMYQTYNPATSSFDIVLG